ncbi:MAG: acetyl-CoA C-acyltransferase [Bacteroidia bacterium]|nr:acetyl-CoA C-acyltransferase [Bacteroidia bacterium]
MKTVYIVSSARTPMGAFGGALASFSATQLGSFAIKGALNKIKLDPNLVQEVIMGNVLSSNLGQAPATQAAIYAGIPNTVPATAVNKVCASGMKALMLAAQSVALGLNDIVVAGGMESMSNVPYYLDKARTGGYRYGNGVFIDGLLKDGLIDVYSNNHMGNCGELCAREHKFTREEQDNFSIESYKRTTAAYAAGKYNEEIIPVEIKQKDGSVKTITEDEQYKLAKFDKIPTLKPAFEKDGTITAANASPLSDGASAVILMSKEKADELGIKPLAIIKGYGDAAHAPEWFTTAPSKALPIALKNAGISQNQIDYFEFNEAFAVVGLVNNKILGIDAAKVNINGGAVAMGHPLGSSGCRIVITLLNVLKQNNAQYGAAAICNGGGGASAMVIENIK